MGALAAIPNEKVMGDVIKVVANEGDRIDLSKQYFWIGNAGRYAYYENDRGGRWVDEVKNQPVDECGAFSVKRFALGDCRNKLPFIC